MILTDPCLFVLCYIVLSCLFQRVIELEADAVHHELIYVDEAGFKLAKQGATAEISLDTVPSSTFRDNVVAT